MLIDIRSPRFSVTPAILRHVEQRLESALGVARSSVVRLGVTLDDVNADRGGADKLCRVVAHCRHLAPVVAESLHEDLYVAIDRAAEKSRREVLRALRRATARERRDRQRPGALLVE